MADEHTRARFIGTGAAGLGGAALASLWGSGAAAAGTTAATGEKATKASTPEPTYVEGAFDAGFSGDVYYVEFDQKAAGWIKGVQGGVGYADVVTEKLGGSYIAKKHIANIKYEDISISSRIGVGKPIFDWVRSTLASTPERRNGAIIAGDFNYVEKAKREFFDALITEISFPALDATSKDPAYMVLKAAPESTRRASSAGTKAPLDPSGLKAVPAAWRFDVEGTEPAAVTKIDGFTIKQSFDDSDGSNGTPAGRVPSKIEIPNLTCSVSLDRSGSWTAWFQDFVLAGNNGDGQERQGSLIFFDEKQAELGRLMLGHVGIANIKGEATENNGDKIRRVQVELYVETMQFEYGSSGTWA